MTFPLSTRSGCCWARRCFSAVPAWTPFDALRNQAFELMLSLNRKSRARLFENLLDGVAEALRHCQDRAALERYMIQTCLGCIRRNDSDDSRWQEDVVEKARQHVDACYMRSSRWRASRRPSAPAGSISAACSRPNSA